MMKELEIKNSADIGFEIVKDNNDLTIMLERGAKKWVSVESLLERLKSVLNKMEEKDQIIRNCVNPEIGKHIIESAFYEDKE